MEKKKFYQSSNFWHNLVTFIISIFTSVEMAQVGSAAGNVIDQVFTQPLQIGPLVVAAYTMMNMIYQLFIKPKTPAPPANPVQ
jgi:uncharacterized membrane protein YkvI